MSLFRNAISITVFLKTFLNAIPPLALLFFCFCEKPLQNTSVCLLEEPEIFPLDSSQSISAAIPCFTDTVSTDSIVPAVKDSLLLLFEEQFNSIKTKGFNSSVYKPGFGQQSFTNGYLDNENTVSVAKTTLWPAGSIFKIFNSVIILYLAQEGKLALSDSITRWFDKYPFLHGITINHLLTNTSGILTSELVRANHVDSKTLLSAEQIIKNVFDTRQGLLFAPGKAYHYSNTGYMMLGIIAEKTSGHTMADLFDELFVKKLGLKNTHYITATNTDVISNVSFEIDGSVYKNAENPSNPHAAGCVASTPEDLIQMYKAILNGDIINQTSLKLLFGNMNLIESTNIYNVYYGRGFSLIRIKVPGKEADYFGHKGYFPCFNSLLFYNVNRNIFFSVMVNQNVPSLDPVMFRLFEKFPVK